MIENANEGTDTVIASTHYRLAANVENLTLTGSADLQAYGNSDANTLTGNAGNNLLDGGAGADTMLGGAGNDIYFVDNIGDRRSRTPAKASIRCSRRLTSGCRRTWMPWFSRAVPTCRATATATPT